jgi:hypothetical protein
MLKNASKYYANDGEMKDNASDGTCDRHRELF